MTKSLSIVWLTFCFFSAASQQALANTNDWQVPAGYQVAVDTSDWSFPVAIQFVQSGGKNPQDPLYYVTELRGRIKVVTNDRTVHIFADQVEDLRAEEELPDLKGEFGLTGLCLDEALGQVYVTTVYRKGGLLFNKIMRFSDGSGKLALRGTKNLEIIELFAADRSSHSHQIGHCAIGQDNKLYVGVGDAHEHTKSQMIDHTNGKILRFNLDGSAPLDNPFYDASNPQAVANFVLAYGFRNPFALAFGEQGQLYVAESGPSIDRLIQLKAGRNYLWNGKDESMTINGIVTWPTPLGPATMTYLQHHADFPQWSQRLLVTASVKAYIQAIWIDNETGAKAPPETIIKYTGNQDTDKQFLVPVAVGPDGIYFSGFLPQKDGQTHIMKIIKSTTAASAVNAGGDKTGNALDGALVFQQAECLTCHALAGKGSKVAPALDNLVPRLLQRLEDETYEQHLQKMEALTDPISLNAKAARQQIRLLQGKEKVSFWIQQRLTEPRWDNADSQMPNFHLSAIQIDALTQFLMRQDDRSKGKSLSALEEAAEELKLYLYTHVSVYVTVMFILGLVLGLWLRGLIRKR